MKDYLKALLLGFVLIINILFFSKTGWGEDIFRIRNQESTKCIIKDKYHYTSNQKDGTLVYSKYFDVVFEGETEKTKLSVTDSTWDKFSYGDSVWFTHAPSKNPFLCMLECISIFILIGYICNEIEWE